jgi:hypothetical protein
MSDVAAGPPPGLRAAIAADLAPVKPLRAPLVRGLALVPIAIVLLVAAPLVFDSRDLTSLGWSWSWGASILQLCAGLALVVAALRESVPARTWSRPALIALAVAPVVIVTAIALVSWQRSPIAIARQGLVVGAMCLAASAITALPATSLAVLLALTAYPTRPAVAGWLAGLGGGLLADAGWRLFCHFSEPSHVLVAHLGSVLVAGAMGAAGARLLHRLRRAD